MSNSSPRAPRVSRAFVLRLARLLHMEYKVSEIADELGVTTKTIYTSYLPAGLPHRRDASGNIWIVGTDFAAWVHAALEKGKRYAAQRRQRIGDNQAFCLSCKSVTEYATITKRRHFSAGRVLVYGTCAACGARMTSMKAGAQ